MNGNIREKLAKFPLFSLLIREFDPESSSRQTASSARQSAMIAFSAGKMRLTPDPTNQMFNRGRFLIHGSHVSDLRSNSALQR
jgi:hypothetical protein